MIAEAYCFVAIGLSVHEFDASQWCWGFIVVMVLVLMAARCGDGLSESGSKEQLTLLAELGSNLIVFRLASML